MEMNGRQKINVLRKIFLAAGIDRRVGVEDLLLYETGQKFREVVVWIADNYKEDPKVRKMKERHALLTTTQRKAVVTAMFETGLINSRNVTNFHLGQSIYLAIGWWNSSG